MPAAWAVGVLGCLAVLHGLGSSALAVPRPWTVGGWAEILTSEGPVMTAMAAIRLAAMALGWYLLVACALAALGRALRLVTLEWAGLALAPARLRREIWAATGMAMVATAVGPSVTAFSGVGAPAAALSPSIADADPSVDAAGGPTLRMRLIEPAPPQAAPPEAAPAERELSWKVRCGDSFWVIAETTLAQAWGRAASDPEVVGYWRQLIEANRDELVDRSNPDLIYPGQEFVVPPPPPSDPPPPPGR